MVGLDAVDEELIKILKENARISYTDLGKELDISDVAARKRIGKLVKNGVIKSFTVELDHSKTGKPLHAFLLVKMSPETNSKAEEKINEIERVLDVYETVGEYDMVVEIACSDLKELKEITKNSIGGIKGIREVRTAIVAPGDNEE